MSRVINSLLNNFESGYLPDKSISIAKLYKLAAFLKDSADTRRAQAEEQNRRHSGGVIQAYLSVNKAELTFLLATATQFEVPPSCAGLVDRMDSAIAGLTGVVLEEEENPRLLDEA